MSGALYTTISTNALVIEPVFFYPDELAELHLASVEPEFLARLPRHPANLEALETC